MHVGLLEDDVAIQEMLVLVLQDEGYTVVNFSSAEACLEAFNTSATATLSAPVDLLIIDWRLGGTTMGTEVIRQLRQYAHLSALPIILTTAATFTDTKTLQDMHISLLEKPFAVDDITALITQLTHSQSSD